MHDLETLTRSELAGILKVSRWTLTRIQARDPNFPAPVKVGAQDRWRRARIERWLSEGETG